MKYFTFLLLFFLSYNHTLGRNEQIFAFFDNKIPPQKMKIGVVLEKYGVAPLIIDNRTYVPIRFVAEELGATVDWNADTQEIVIRK